MVEQEVFLGCTCSRAPDDYCSWYRMFAVKRNNISHHLMTLSKKNMKGNKRNALLKSDFSLKKQKKQKTNKKKTIYTNYKNKLYKILRLLIQRYMLNFDFLHIGMEIVSPPHFVYNFSRKIILMLNKFHCLVTFISWDVYSSCNMFIATVC